MKYQKSIISEIEKTKRTTKVTFKRYGNRTVEDFGDQWLRYRQNEGYYASLELFSDILYPFLIPAEIKDCKVGEIGSGTGRIVNMLLQAGAKHVVAIEPSNAFDVLCQNIEHPERVTCLKITGDQLPAFGDLDYIFSVGVLHHVPYPLPVIKAAFRALRPGGRFFIWVYGREGNNLYLAFVWPLRVVTRHLPHYALASLVEILYWPLLIYMKLCPYLPLPLNGYMVSVLQKMTPRNRRLIIYDQLNPAYAKYYSKSEAEGLLVKAGFTDVQAHHRHGYSWTVIGTKPWCE
jgi:SAM-dependent methyltransferase